MNIDRKAANRMNHTKIPWCDLTWNPIVGCSPVSEGCEHCYAAAISKRFNKPWGHPVLHRDRLDQPAKEKKPSRIFVCSMSDLFHNECTVEMQEAVFCAMRDAPWHTYMLLTKRPHNMRRAFHGRGAIDNWCCGVTAENQGWANARMSCLLSIRCRVRFVSAEPLLGPIDLNKIHGYWGGIGLDWVIAGPENGPGARECNPQWIELLADQCWGGNIPFFDKRENFIRREFPKGIKA